MLQAVGRSAEFRSYCNARTSLYNREVPVLLTKTLPSGCWAFLFLRASDYSSGRCVVAAANDWHFRWSLMHEAMAARFGQPPPGAGNAPGKAPAATGPPPPRTVPATGAAAPSDDWVRPRHHSMRLGTLAGIESEQSGIDNALDEAYCIGSRLPLHSLNGATWVAKLALANHQLLSSRLLLCLINIAVHGRKILLWCLLHICGC